ncbi:MAG TPA: hypothetical protein VKA65_13195 [Acidimicrobiales bacterium]|jgi:hypothetical protein|nr:hypothetical protein [Acidimicrobiales bacterium]
MSQHHDVAQPTRITAPEAWHMTMVERQLVGEFGSSVPVAEIQVAIEDALAALEPLARRELIPQLVLRAVRTDLQGRTGTDPTRRPLVRPLTS